MKKTLDYFFIKSPTLILSNHYKGGQSSSVEGLKDYFDVIRHQAVCPTCGKKTENLAKIGNYECPDCKTNFELIKHLISAEAQSLSSLTWDTLQRLSAFQLGAATHVAGEKYHFNPRHYLSRPDVELILDNFVQEVANNNDRKFFLLLGSSGLGKTWLLNFFGYHLLQQEQVAFYINEPFQVFCSTVFQASLTPTLSKLACLAEENQRPIYLIMDGYERIHSAIRDLVFTEVLDKFICRPYCAVILSSRVYDWHMCRTQQRYQPVYSKVLYQPYQDRLLSFQLGELSSEKIHSLVIKNGLPSETSQLLRDYTQSPLWIRLLADYYKDQTKLPEPQDIGLLETFYEHLGLKKDDLVLMGRLAQHILVSQNDLTSETAFNEIDTSSKSILNQLISTGVLVYTHDEEPHLRFALEPLTIYALITYWIAEWRQRTLQDPTTTISLILSETVVLGLKQQNFSKRLLLEQIFKRMLEKHALSDLLDDVETFFLQITIQVLTGEGDELLKTSEPSLMPLNPELSLIRLQNDRNQAQGCLLCGEAWLQKRDIWSSQCLSENVKQQFQNALENFSQGLENVARILPNQIDKLSQMIKERQTEIKESLNKFAHFDPERLQLEEYEKELSDLKWGIYELKSSVHIDYQLEKLKDLQSRVDYWIEEWKLKIQDVRSYMVQDILEFQEIDDNIRLFSEEMNVQEGVFEKQYKKVMESERQEQEGIKQTQREKQQNELQEILLVRTNLQQDLNYLTLVTNYSKFRPRTEKTQNTIEALNKKFRIWLKRWHVWKNSVCRELRYECQDITTENEVFKNKLTENLSQLEERLGQ